MARAWGWPLIGLVIIATLASGNLALAEDKRPDTSDLIVWSGAKPAGKTWAKLGPNGSFKSEDDSGLDKKPSLVLRMNGTGFRGCGLNWHGWYPADAATDVSHYAALVFHIRQVTAIRDADLTVHLIDNVKRTAPGAASNALTILGDGGLSAIDGTWRRVVLPLSRFAKNQPLRLDRLWELDFSNQGNADLVFQIDNIGFTMEKPAPPRFVAGPSYAATGMLLLDVRPTPISPGIYGVADWTRDKLVEYRIPITRWGGNTSTRYNWMLGVENSGADWYFRNHGQKISRPEESGYLKLIQRNKSIGATSYQTVPMIGWVSKDGMSHAFSIAKYGKQKATEPGNPDVGNGLQVDGKLVTGNDPHDTSIESSPDFIAEAVRFVVQKAGDARSGGVRYWVLDNEPMLWHSTHRDVHPKPLTYDELWNSTVRYAEAIKRADPTAKVAGFCSWGWLDLEYSAADGVDNYRTKADWVAHDRVGLCVWFLDKCGEYRKMHGKPLIDVLDIHWYPQGEVKGIGAYQGKGMDPDLNAYRLRSTRDLWDTTYEQESWIRRTANYVPVALLPRIKKWVEKHNPGMEICLGEYNFGGSDNISGALAQSETLGILAREAIQLAFLWSTPEGSQELGWQLFRNYDGKRHGFGEQYVASRSDHADVAMFAARRDDGTLTVVVLNKNLHGPCDFRLDLAAERGKFRMFRFDQESGDKVSEVKTAANDVSGTLELRLPAASANLLEITPLKRP